MAEGTKIGAYGLTEPGSGSDAGAMGTTAKLDGDDYVLNGSKIFITNGGIADIYIVFAITNQEEGKRHGNECFHRRKRLPRLLCREKREETRHSFITDN